MPPKDRPGVLDMARLNRDIEPDSPYGGGEDRPGRVRRLFGGGEDPLSLAFPLMRVGRLRVRVHWVLPLYLACELVAWIPSDKVGPSFSLPLVGSLLVLALVREVVRGWFARWLGSNIDHVTVWPLGGLNSVARASCPHPVAAEVGGLIVILLLVPILAAAALLTGATEANLLFNPFNPGAVFGGHLWPMTQVILWSAYYANLDLAGAEPAAAS